MASSAGDKGSTLSAAMLMDPRAMKMHLANGTSFSSHSESISMATRRNSEPPASLLVSSSGLTAYDTPLQFTKDDAYEYFADKGKKAVGRQQHVGQMSSSHLDAKRLLDPIGFDKSNLDDKKSSFELNPSKSPGSVAVNGNGPHKRNHEECEGQGMGNLIERVHNVSQREERPQKKQKAEGLEDDADKQATFSGGGKGGEIGEYMRQKRKEGLAEASSVNPVVDLTGGTYPHANLTYLDAKVRIGDDEDIVLISDSQQKEVCYGRLGETKVHAHQLPTPSGKAMYLSKGQWPAMKLDLRRHPGKDSIIRVIDPTGKDFGNVDVKTSLALARIMDSRHPRFRTQARLLSRNRKADDYPGKECSEYFDITINLYGPKNKSQTMGKFLSQKNVWLRQPFMVDSGVEVINPHQQAAVAPRSTIGGTHGSSTNGNGTAYVTRTTEEIRSDVTSMFDSLEQSEHLPEMDPDPRVTTELLTHQKQGLYFLTNKEKARVYSDQEEVSTSLWRMKFNPNGRHTYYNVITGQEERTKPPEVLGGILADMMGLGKTLSILSMIVGSLYEAKHWGKESCPESDGDKALMRNSRTTLLICPLSTVANWEEQIATHIKPGSLKYYIYHGCNRISDIDDLARYDIVITTYSIVSSEFTGRGKRKDTNLLFQTNFFRIVLDEAHMIREQATRQSQATCALSAQRRWAVTVCTLADPHSTATTSSPLSSVLHDHTL